MSDINGNNKRCVKRMHFSFFLLLCVLSFSTCFASESTTGKPIWLVVTKTMFTDTLRPLIEKRQNDGLEAVISTKPISEALESLPEKPSYILLIGDCESGKEKEPWYVPTQMFKAYRWYISQGEEFASDAILGDFDGDMIPDVPVGRLPVRTTDQLQLVIKKILAYENRTPSLDDLRLPIYTGSADFQPTLDSMVTGFLLDTLDKKGAKWLQPWIIAGNETHVLSGWPEEQPQTFTEELKKGGVMGVFMGHGAITSFFGMNFRGMHLSYTADKVAGLLLEGKPSPPTVIVACNTGNFTYSRSSLTESLLFLPAGPVAAIGATTISHPMTNYFAGINLLRRPGQENPANKRLGTMWLDVQKETIQTRDLIMEAILMNVEPSIQKKVDASKIRRDHILMYALLGDPATQLRMPQPLKCKIEKRDDNWYWEVEKPKGATKLYVEIRPDGQTMPKIQLPLEKESAQKNLQLANDTFVFNSITELPSDTAWRGVINTSGILRLVAMSPDNIFVAAQELE